MKRTCEVDSDCHCVVEIGGRDTIVVCPVERIGDVRLQRTEPGQTRSRRRYRRPGASISRNGPRVLISVGVVDVDGDDRAANDG